MSAALPVARGYRHSTEETAEIASRFTILRTEVGSGVHGVTVSEEDDRDEMGICVEPPEYVIGVKKILSGDGTMADFEQYEYRSQPPHHRSGAGDLDVTVYSLRKWMRLALNGNPTVLTPLFVPRAQVVQHTYWGRQLRNSKGIHEWLLSRQAGERFLGYLHAQRERLITGSHRTNRPELINRYGFDTKFAYHAVRLGIQGCELLRTGRITLPMPEPHRTWLQELRRGEHAKDEALDCIAIYENTLRHLTEHSTVLAAKPDYDAASRWLVEVYQDVWAHPEELT